MKTIYKNTIILIFLILLYNYITGCSIFEDDKVERYYEGYKISSMNIGLHEKPIFSPDGNQLAFLWRDTTGQPTGIYIMNMITQEKYFLIEANSFDWSHDNRWIVFSRNGNIGKIKINGDSISYLTFDGMNINPSWNPTYDLIVFENTFCGSVVDPLNDTCCGIILINSNGTNRKRIIYGYGWPTWSPDGKYVLYNGPNIYNIDSNYSLNFVVPSYGGTPARYSPDGKKIIYSSQNGIWIIFVDNGQVKKLIPQHENMLIKYRTQKENNGYHAYKGPKILIVKNPSWHPNNEYIIYEHYEVIGKICNDVDGCIVFMNHNLYYLNIDSAITISNL